MKEKLIILILVEVKNRDFSDFEFLSKLPIEFEFKIVM